MSKKAKSRSRKKRLEEKRKRKSEKKALYEGYAARGRNSKSKRYTLKAKQGIRFRAERHKHGDCGNVGCIRCQGINFKLFMTDNGPKLPPKYWLRMQVENAGRPYP